MTETIEELVDRVRDGSGYGDPEARLNDDRRLQVELARVHWTTARRLNQLTLLLVLVAVLNVVVLVAQLIRNH